MDQNEPKHPDMGYVDLLDAALTAKEENKDHTKSYFPLRPSSAGKCERALFYALEEHRGKKICDKTPMEPNVIRLLSLGHSIEYSMIQSFYEMAKQFDFRIKYKQHVVSTMKLNDGKIIEGSIDFCLESDEYKCVCDAKSKKDAFSKAFKTRFDDELDKYSKYKSLRQLSATCFYAEDLAAFIDELGNDFKIDNLLQLNLYSCSRFFVERGYDHASLLYYNKNDSRMMEIRFKPDPLMVEVVKEKFQKAYDAKKASDTEKTYRLGSIRCAFCPYNKVCWSSKDPLKEWFATLPKKSFPKDIGKIKGKSELKKLFKKYEDLEEISSEKGRIEEELCDILSEKKINKIKLDNGNVYVVKLLKSPREHMELRRSKV